MDGLIYTAMTGAKQIMEQQATATNNLANVSTTGFRAQYDSFRAIPVVGGSGSNTRTFVVDSTTGSNFAPGPLQQTGNNLDVAVQGSGWIAVDMGNGTEAYTRNGSLRVNSNGELQTWDGHAVLGVNGPITLPPGEKVQIGVDGTVSSIPETGVMSSVNVQGQIKLVNPPTSTLVRGDDGYFRLASGKPADADPAVKLVSGALEGSNVNAVSAMVDIINMSQQFSIQMKLLTNAENDESKASQLMTLA